MKTRSLGVGLVAFIGACAPGGRPYPPLEASASCESHPHLCGLDARQVRGAADTDAFKILFVGDGYTANSLEAYREDVRNLVVALRSDPESFVAWDTQLFAFYRADLSASGDDTSNQNRLDTPLGVYPRPEDCWTFITAHRPAVEWVAAEAAEKMQVAQFDAIVVLGYLAVGRPNADGKIVHLSSLSDERALIHELGHAIFNLGDEYVDYTSCSEPPARSEADLLHVANVTIEVSPAKWNAVVASLVPGALRVPCAYHPTEHCTMLDASEPFCPVCEAAVREAMAARRCGPDRFAPRVTITDIQWVDRATQRARVTMAAYDERGVVGYEILHEGEVVATATNPWADFNLTVPAETYPEIMVRARDATGNSAASSPAYLPALAPAEPTTVPSIDAAAAEITSNGWLKVDATISPLGATLIVSHGGQELARKTVWDSTTVYASAAAAWGPTAEITLVAVDEGGVSTPQMLSVAAPEQLAEPFFGLWWFPDFALPLDGLGTSVHAEVLIASKRPVEVVGAAVSWWGTLGHARPTFPVTLVPLDLSAWQDQTITDVELFVRDTWGAHAETPWLSSAQVVSPSDCGFAPAEVVSEPYSFAGLLHPVRVSVAGPWSVIQARVYFEGRRVEGTYVSEDGSSVLIPVSGLQPSDQGGGASAGPIDGGTVEILLIAAVDCPDVGWTLFSQTIPVRVDHVPPRVFVQSQVHVGRRFRVFADDGGGIAHVEVAWPSGAREVVAEPPYAFVAQSGTAIVKVVDRGQNVMTQAVSIVEQPEYRPTGLCGEVQ